MGLYIYCVCLKCFNFTLDVYFEFILLRCHKRSNNIVTLEEVEKFVNGLEEHLAKHFRIKFAVSIESQFRNFNENRAFVRRLIRIKPFQFVGYLAMLTSRSEAAVANNAKLSFCDSFAIRRLKRRCRSREIFGGAKDYCPNFPKLAQKFFVRLLLTNFLPETTSRPVFDVTPKKVLIVFFCKRWAPFFEVKQRWGPFLPGFSGILPRFPRILYKFSTNQNFWGCACIHASYTTGLKNCFSLATRRIVVQRSFDKWHLALR